MGIADTVCRGPHRGASAGMLPLRVMDWYLKGRDGGTGGFSSKEAVKIRSITRTASSFFSGLSSAPQLVPFDLFCYCPNSSLLRSPINLASLSSVMARPLQFALTGHEWDSQMEWKGKRSGPRIQRNKLKFNGELTHGSIFPHSSDNENSYPAPPYSRDQ